MYEFHEMILRVTMSLMNQLPQSDLKRRRQTKLGLKILKLRT